MTTKTKEVLTLESVAPRLGEDYKQWKHAESEKNKRKEEFYQLADLALTERGLAMKVIDMEGDSEEIARERVKRHYPSWNIDHVRPHRAHQGIFEAILMEDPTFKSFSYEHEGVKYARSVRKGTVMVDDEWLQDTDPELYEEITFALPWGERIVRPIDGMDKETLGKLTKYIYNAKPSISLAAPRAVKVEQ